MDETLRVVQAIQFSDIHGEGTVDALWAGREGGLLAGIGRRGWKQGGWCTVVWAGLVWCGVVWCSVVCSVVWCSVVWCSVV